MSIILEERSASSGGQATSPADFERRLASADRALQQEKGTLIFLRSWRWLGAWFLGALVADVLLHFSASVRLALSLGFVALVFATMGMAVWLAFVRRGRSEHTARVLEARDARLGSKLINILQLRAQASDSRLAPLTRELADHAVADSVAEIQHIDLPQLAATQEPARAAKQLAFALGGLLLLLGIAHEITRVEVPRFLDPFGDHPPYSFTRISITEPIADGAQVVFGQSLLVSAQTRGHRPGDLFLTFHPPNQPGQATTVPMFDKGERGFAQQIERIKTDLVLVAHTKTWHSRSTQRHLSVVLTPRLEKAALKITPPAYTELPTEERAVPLGKSFKALAGSRMEFRIESNRPLREGRIELVKGPGDIQVFALAPAGERAVSGAFEAATAGLLRFTLVDEAGNPSEETWECTLQVTHDLPPDVQVSNPSSDAFVAMDFKVEPTFEANDDYGVKTLRIHQGLNGSYGDPRVVSFERVTRNVREVLPLDLATMDLKSGDRLSFFAEAIDTAPETHVARSQTVTLTVISVAEYNDFLRERTDLADIAAKYADLFKNLQDLIEEQKQLGEQIETLKEQLETAPDKVAAQTKLDELLAKQNELNARLNKLADTMENFVRKEPLYDLEAELGETLKQKAEQIRESTQANDQAAQQVAQRSSPPNASRQLDQPMLEDFKKASDEQLARLGAAEQQAQDEVAQPLDDLSLMHEILKDINRFKELYAAQQQVAEQAKAYDRAGPLSREDQLALKNLAAMEKRIGEELEAVQERLAEDGKAAMEKFPKAGQSAQNLAQKMGDLGLTRAAGRATDAMLAGHGDQGSQLAQQLAEDMEKMFSECNGSSPSMSDELDQYLKISRGMNPGKNFRQMMQSRKFGNGNKPGFGIGQGETGPDGTSGYAMDSAAETPVLGNESRPNDSRARRPGEKGFNRLEREGGKPVTATDEPDILKNVQASGRDSNAVQGESSIEQYRDLVDKYFKAITK
ncbi:MAG TPA: hypothetical protein VFD27_22480 [Chthoniobacteraceae bacterium]|nr:hypothetical protein [Chthoniobacteraceae bacterium]